MKIFALIKKKNKLRTVSDDDVRASVNAYVNINIRNYLESLNPSDRITLDSLDSLYYSNETLSTYTADRVLKRLIRLKKRHEIKKILLKVLESYEVGDVVSYLLNNPNFYDCFYTDLNGKVKVNNYMLEDLFNNCFQDQGEEILKALVSAVESTDFSLEYYCFELSEYFSSNSFEVTVNKRNFETFLRELGEVGNPAVDSSQKHSCYNCKLLSPSLCEKAEYVKKSIGDYPFIESGYQIFSLGSRGRWDLVSFRVTHCYNYKYVSNSNETKIMPESKTKTKSKRKTKTKSKQSTEAVPWA